MDNEKKKPKSYIIGVTRILWGWRQPNFPAKLITVICEESKKFPGTDGGGLQGIAPAPRRLATELYSSIFKKILLK